MSRLTRKWFQIRIGNDLLFRAKHTTGILKNLSADDIPDLLIMADDDMQFFDYTIQTERFLNREHYVCKWIKGCRTEPQLDICKEFVSYTLESYEHKVDRLLFLEVKAHMEAEINKASKMIVVLKFTSNLDKVQSNGI